ncbi:MAG: ABC transporter substrate-binding protein, partial [Clostridia bacterium]|nr:ABC transporter substrate-binding protein [Clostridia bacterium]
MMKKTLSLLLALLLGLSLLTGCSTDSGDAGDGGEQTGETGEPVGETGEPVGETGEPSAEPVTIRLGGLKGPTSMGLVKLIDDASQGLTESKIDFRMAGTANELTPLMVQGELDVLAGPSNLAAILYQNTKGAVQFAAINTLGVIYLVEKGGNTVATMEDLRGKTIYATGKGQIPEYALTYLLEQHGMEVGKDVEIEWKSEATEVVATIAMEDSAVALLPQPYVTVAQTQVEGLAIALNLTEQWDALQNGSQLITAGLIVRREFAEQHPEALATLMEEYAA